MHGGPDYAEPVLIDATVLDRLATYQDLAPLHQPNNLAPIRLAMEIDPAVPQVACFDTAFHRGHADAHRLLRAAARTSTTRACAATASTASPTSISPSGCARWRPSVARGRVIVAHLGSGASMCALLDGRSIESTMGFTALDGLPMGTRPGQLDPGVVLYLIEQRGMSRARGLRPSLPRLRPQGPLRHLQRHARPPRQRRRRAPPSPSTTSSTAAPCTPARSRPPSAASTPSSSPPASARTRPRSAPASPSASPGSAPSSTPPPTMPARRCISTPASRVALLVVPTDEELMIARHTLALIGAPAAA